MTTLNINGRRVKVDDSFRILSPEDQERTVNEIASQMGLADQPDPAPDAAPADGMGTAEDILRSGGAGLRSGLEGIVGAPGASADMTRSLGGWIGEQLGSRDIGETIGQGINYLNPLTAFGPSPDQLRAATDAVIGEAHQPQTTAGKYARTVGEFVPSAALSSVAGGGPMASTLARYALAPGLASEAVGQAVEGSPYEQYARIAASLLAPMAISGVERLISPYGGRISPERLRAADTLRAEGIQPTAGQTTGSRALLATESELGGARMADILDDQSRAFTEAAMRRAGQSGTATPENMAAMRDRLGQGFTDISARSTLRADQGLVSDMNRTMQEYGRTLPSDQRQIVGRLGQDIVDRFKSGSGSMPGAEYQTIRSRLGRMAQSARNSDPEYSSALRGMRNALDNAMARSIPPEDAATWAQLRREYGNMKVLEKAATGAGADAAMGNISPARLRQASTTGRQGAYARGEGDFDQLARAGTIGLNRLQDSGTATRLNARTFGGIGGVLGAGGGAMTGDPANAMIGALLGMAAPNAAGRAMLSRPVQAWLVNQAVTPGAMLDPRLLGVAQSLMSGEQ